MRSYAVLYNKETDRWLVISRDPNSEYGLNEFTVFTGGLSYDQAKEIAEALNFKERH